MTYLNYIRTILPATIRNRELIAFNGFIVSISLISLTQENFQWEGVVSIAIVVLPSLISLIGNKSHTAKSLLAYLGLTTGLLFALYSNWAPAAIVILFMIPGMLSVMFIDRKWGGLLILFAAIALSIPIAMTMTGFSKYVPIRFHDEVLIIAITIGSVGLNGLVIAYRHRRLNEKVKKSTRLVAQMQEVYVNFEKAILTAPNVEEMFWLVTDLCIPLLKLEDCVIYTLDHEIRELKQVAAYGPKSKTRGEILSPLQIKVGEGIVGKCAELMQEIKIDDLSKVDSYIEDDLKRLSELAVPIVFEGKVYGVIDSEHSKKCFFTEENIVLFRFIASLCAGKIGEFQLIDSKVEKANTERALSQATQVEQLRNTFLNNLSHDLRTPLSLIRGPLQELKKNRDLNVSKLADVGLRNADRLNEMVGGLLDMHKLERGGLKLTVSKWDLSTQVKDWYALFLHEAEIRNIDYQLTLLDEQELKCDAAKIGQIIQNLLSNAFKFTPDNGKISLLTNFAENRLTVEVHDSGPGIATKNKSHVFERFFKVDSDSHVQGTGLGLAIVKELTELMNGSVEVIESEFGGAGFRVTLPLSQQEKRSIKKNGVKYSPLSNKPQVVFVEDHPEMREFVSEILAREFEVNAAPNAEEGWQLILEKMPDLIVTDLMLPGMNGDELCERIKSNIATDHLPVIALSAKHSTESRIELYSFGADNYITKPFETEELLGIARSVIEQRRKLREHYSEGQSPSQPTAGMVKIDEIIAREIDNSDYGPRDLEKEIGLNRNQLQKKIKHITGYTPVEYFRIFRLEAARKLIMSGESNVSEAAFKTGFNQVAYFSSSYKKHFGKSPSEDVPMVS